MSIRGRNALASLALFAVAVLGGCLKSTYVVVPRPSGGYRAIDTLLAYQNGNVLRVVFRFDTITHTRTLYRVDTLWRDGRLILHDTVRLVRRDTLRLIRRDTLWLVRRDTVRVVTGGGRVDTVRVAGSGRVDTVRVERVDTVRIAGAGRVDTVRVSRVDTVRFVGVDTVRITTGGGRVDTVRVIRVDTVRIASGGGRVDTVRIVRTDTVRLAGRRTTFVPPGQYPPAGQCRVWIYNRPPGQQASPAPCNQLGTIPAGAFILFNGDAWDFDYDWIAYQRAGGNVPPQILALKRP